ncbi:MULTISPECIES: DUF2690 domain-containing protein [unclassified Streptomyces]|uniref:DUF2690 domain-containing protein n=1 Tax=unclassified Streptomyces TaxID=2593676 RepID=UPI002B1CC76B|nr:MULTISPECIES: DUF2690 domain-containing protein [unclassified Streptomyces]
MSSAQTPRSEHRLRVVNSDGAIVKKMVTRGAAVSVAALALTLIPLAGTSYAASCSGAGCDNKGPVATGCDSEGVTTPREIDNNGRVAQLRWSAGCSAAWVRVVQQSSNPIYNATGYIEKYNSSGTLLKSLSVSFPSSGSDWSNMLGGASYYYRVCVSFQGDEYPLKCSTKF